MKKTQANVLKAKHACEEAFYWRADGTKGDDWIHKEILDNPEADKAFRDSVIRKAVAGGMSLEVAHQLFGSKS